ncbi:hypothetical protein BC828DRAFT_390431 [Blastocladiella britannica]|nr:hypothetical protein BC828DRAFT_390431 [Blastocladiella britannica]
MNALPRHDMVLSAVLSRGFREFSSALAVKHGHKQLLRHYPRHVLYNGLARALDKAAQLGDLSALVQLWELAGPTSPARGVWFIRNSTLFVDTAIEHGRLHVLEWFVGVAEAYQLPLIWPNWPWNRAASKGHIEVIQWGLDRGYLNQLDEQLAPLSTKANGDMTLFLQWIASIDDMSTIDLPDLVDFISAEGLIQVLDWHWVNMADCSELPTPPIFAQIIDQTLANGPTSVLDWWWTRFCTFRTPAHTFGSSRAIKQLRWCTDSNITNAEWLWQYSHWSGSLWNESIQSAFAFPSDWKTDEVDVTGLLGPKYPEPLVLQWCIEKCATLGLKLKVTADVVAEIVRQGDVGMLDALLQSTNTVQMKWGRGLVVTAVTTAQLAVLQWWEFHCAELPPQDLTRFPAPGIMTMEDHVEVVEWCHAHMQLKKENWIGLCMNAIKHNSLRIQTWFIIHLDLICLDGDSKADFQRIWPADPFVPMLFTLDFVAAIATDIETHDLTQLELQSYTTTYWQCLHSGIDIKALIPTTWKWNSLFTCNDVVTLERWLQAHLAAGCPLVLPGGGSSSWRTEPGTWLHDVTVMRKVPFMLE